MFLSYLLQTLADSNKICYAVSWIKLPQSNVTIFCLTWRDEPTLSHESYSLIFVKIWMVKNNEVYIFLLIYTNECYEMYL